MKKKSIRLSIVFSLVLVLATAIFYVYAPEESNQEQKRPEDAMESPPSHTDSDMEYATDMISYRLQALELFDAYDGDDPEIESVVNGLSGVYESDIQEIKSEINGWGEEPPEDSKLLSEGELEGGISEEDLEALRKAGEVEADDLFRELFIGNLRGVVGISTALGGAGQSSEIGHIAEEASAEATTLIMNLENEGKQ